MTKILRISTKREGYRRCGLAHHGTKDHSLDRFTAEQVETLRADPLLVVQELDEGAAAAEAAATKAEANGQALEIVEAARFQADQIIKTAETTSATILANAEAEANAIKAAVAPKNAPEGGGQDAGTPATPPVAANSSTRESGGGKDAGAPAKPPAAATIGGKAKGKAKPSL